MLWLISPFAYRQKPQPGENVPQAVRPAIQVEGVEGLALQREGRKVWELYVDQVTLTKDESQAWARGVRKAIYYGPNGKPVMTVSADALTYNGINGEVVLSGNIRLVASLDRKGTLRGRAEQALWSERSQRLEVYKAVGEVNETRFLFAKGAYLPHTAVIECSGGVALMSPTVQVDCPSLRGNVERGFYSLYPPVLIRAYLNGMAPVMPLQLLSYQPAPKQTALTQEKKEEKKDKKKREVIFETKQQVIAKDRRWFITEGMITEKGEDYRVEVKRAVYDERTETIEIQDGVRFDDPETVATAPKGKVDMRKRVANFEGPVEVIVKPKQEEERPAGPGAGARSKGETSKTDGEEKGKEEGSPVTPGSGPEKKQGSEKNGGASVGKPPAKTGEGAPYRERVRRRGGRITCDRADYYYRERRVEATGRVQFKQEDRYEGSAEKATYLVREEILTLEGQVVVRDLKKGHRFECPKVVLNLKTDDIEVSPPVKGLFIVEEEEEKETKEIPPKEGVTPETKEPVPLPAPEQPPTETKGPEGEAGKTSS